MQIISVDNMKLHVMVLLYGSHLSYGSYPIRDEDATESLSVVLLLMLTLYYSSPFASSANTIVFFFFPGINGTMKSA